MVSAHPDSDINRIPPSMRLSAAEHYVRAAYTVFGIIDRSLRSYAGQRAYEENKAISSFDEHMGSLNGEYTDGLWELLLALRLLRDAEASHELFREQLSRLQRWKVRLAHWLLRDVQAL